MVVSILPAGEKSAKKSDKKGQKEGWKQANFAFSEKSEEHQQ